MVLAVVHKGEKEPIVRLIETVNAAVAGHGLPVLTAHPHVSIGWFIPDMDTLPSFDTSPETEKHMIALFGKVALDSVKIKCGRLVQSVHCTTGSGG